MEIFLTCGIICSCGILCNYQIFRKVGYSTLRVDLGRKSSICEAREEQVLLGEAAEVNRMLTVDRRVRKTKKAIQDAYFRLLEKKKSEKITVAEITREADIDRKTFYLHYGSVEDVIREWTEATTRDILKRLTLKSFFTLKFDKEIFAREAISMVSENLSFLKMVAGSPDLDFFWNTAQDTAVDVLTDIYAGHSKMPIADLRIQVRFFVGGAAAACRDWLKGRIPCTLDQLSNRVSGIAFTGVRSILTSPEANEKRLKEKKEETDP